MLPLPEGPFEWAELVADPFTALVSARSPLAERTEISLEELGRLPLVCFRSCRITQIALDDLRAQGIEPTIVFRSDQNEVIQGAVAIGRGHRFPAEPLGRRARPADEACCESSRRCRRA